MERVIYTHKTQYYETDKMGIIHHSNYIRWFEESRCYFMEKIGFSYFRMEEEGIISPVLEAYGKYRSMVHFGDSVDIEVSVASFNGIKLKLEYTVRDHETQEVRTTGFTSHCFLNTQGKPVSLKKTQTELYQKMMEYVSSEKSSTPPQCEARNNPCNHDLNVLTPKSF